MKLNPSKKWLATAENLLHGWGLASPKVLKALRANFAAQVAESRKIRYMSHARARKAGKWAIEKYSRVFKKLAEE